MEREAASWLLLLTCWLVLLVVGGAIINGVFGMRDRKWIRRLRGIESGRAAQRSQP
jgi:hypothetical protein